MDLRWSESNENNSLFAVGWSFHLMSYSDRYLYNC
jgi:hypothetical protein